MKGDKVKQFMELAGQKVEAALTTRSPEIRALGAQLLLSEVLEYVIKGLGVTPEFNGTKITDANSLKYLPKEEPDPLEMIDGLADTAYTMYWNALAFGMPLERAYDIVCDNNLEKFVRMPNWNRGEVPLESAEWDCGQEIVWPQEVVEVSVIQTSAGFFAVGKDRNGKVRKPSSYKQVDLTPLLQRAA